MMGKKEKQACGRKPVYRDDEFIAGEHVWSLTVTGIPTAWTENRARRGKGSIGVLNQIMDIGKRIPMGRTTPEIEGHGVIALTELHKIAIGMFITVVAFAIPAWIQIRIDAGATPHIGWQLLAYVVLTGAEVMVSITCLEFSYTQAPKAMKSFAMAFGAQ